MDTLSEFVKGRFSITHLTNNVIGVMDDIASYVAYAALYVDQCDLAEDSTVL